MALKYTVGFGLFCPPKELQALPMKRSVLLSNTATATSAPARVLRVKV